MCIKISVYKSETYYIKITNLEGRGTGDFSIKIEKAKEDVRKLRADMEEKKDIGKRLDTIRKQLQNGNIRYLPIFS